jgi:hypothetical protein
MFELGLRRYPPLETIINLCASSDATIRPIALKYFLDNISSRYPQYDPMNFAEVAFVPTTTRMGTPKEVSFDQPLYETGLSSQSRFSLIRNGPSSDSSWCSLAFIRMLDGSLRSESILQLLYWSICFAVHPHQTILKHGSGLVS